MPDVHEVFRRATQQVRPDPGATARQEARQRRAGRNRRLSALATVAAIIAAFVFAVTRPPGPVAPATRPTPTRTPRPLGVVIVGLDGRVQRTFPGIRRDAFEPSLSPDGSEITYITNSIEGGGCGTCAGTIRIVMSATDGSGWHFVAHVSQSTGALPCLRGTCFGQPVWSPDGSRIAFVMTRAGNTDVYVMNPDGSDVRRLTTSLAEDEFPAWSPDGKTIAYDSSGPRRLNSSGFSATQEIWSVPAAGGSPVRLTNNSVPDQAPTYSPDGSKIALFHAGSISVMSASGGAIHPLPGNPQGFTPRWSPDGKQIAYLGYYGNRGTIADPRSRGTIFSLPLGEVKVVDVSSGVVTDLGVEVPSSTNAVSWTPSSDALLVDRFRS